SEEHTSELQSRFDLVCRLLLEKKRHQGGLLDGGRAARGRLLRGPVEEAEQVMGRLRGRRRGGDGSSSGASAGGAPAAGPDLRILLLRALVLRCFLASSLGLFHRMAGMPLDPLYLVAAPGERAIYVLEQIPLLHGLFFLLTPPPPRSTLFPYTTLFR